MALERKEFRDLIDFISKSNFVEFEMEREGFRLRLVKGGASPVVPVATPATPAAPTEAPALTPVAPAPAAAAENEKVHRVRAPIVGTFFRAPSPNSPPFVEVGDRVRKGQTLCIIEAMKVMNEIESEFDGEILEVGAANGQPVEFGEVLFRLQPLPAAG